MKEIVIGSVYAVGVDGRVKIGFSSEPEKRTSVAANQLGLGDDCLKYISPECENPRKQEMKIHNLLSDLRVGGEVFNVTFSKAISTIESSIEIMNTERFHEITKINKKAKDDTVSGVIKLIDKACQPKPRNSEQFEKLRKIAVDYSDIIDDPEYLELIMSVEEGNCMQMSLEVIRVQSELIRQLSEATKFFGDAYETALNNDKS